MTDTFVGPFIRAEYNYDGDAVSLETQSENWEPTLTIQSAAAECEIMSIVTKFGLTGFLPQPRGIAEYGDFSGAVDYHTALNQILEAQESFDSLPPELRARFENDAGKLWDFLQDDANMAEAVELGIIAPEPVEAPPSPAVPDPSPDTPTA